MPSFRCSTVEGLFYGLYWKAIYCEKFDLIWISFVFSCRYRLSLFRYIYAEAIIKKSFFQFAPTRNLRFQKKIRMTTLNLEKTVHTFALNTLST
jgi:hypothetical protein